MCASSASRWRPIRCRATSSRPSASSTSAPRSSAAPWIDKENLMQERIRKIKEARTLLAAAMQGCELPQIEAMLRNADMELHWALWNLGEAVPLRPELG